MSTSCDNAATMWTQNDNLILLTIGSDWCSEAVSGQCPIFENTLLHQRFPTVKRLAEAVLTTDQCSVGGQIVKLLGRSGECFLFKIPLSHSNWLS